MPKIIPFRATIVLAIFAIAASGCTRGTATSQTLPVPAQSSSMVSAPLPLTSSPVETSSLGNLPSPAPLAVAFANAAAHVQFDYPAAWHGVKDDTLLTLVPADQTAIGSTHIVIDQPDLPPHIPGWIPLGAVQGGFIDDLRQRYAGVIVDKTADQSLAGAGGRWIAAHGFVKTTPAIPVTIEAILVVRNDRVYMIDAEAPSASRADMADAFQTITHSWRWMN